MRVADAEGLRAVSMRRVAAELGTGAASLYRYVEAREDLLDLMTDAAGAEHELAPPTGDWLADLVAFGEQARAIFRRHRWLAGLTLTRPVIGPNGTALIEHFLTLLHAHPAGIEAKMEAFGMLNGITAAFALQEQTDPACGRATSPTSATPSPPAGAHASRRCCPREHSRRLPRTPQAVTQISSPAS